MTKPPYRVMSMAEIRALKPNGFTVASTFSGGGGSSTGYRMAGFRVVWANEFIDAARETYKANAAPYTVVDGRDVRLVKAEDILAATGLKEGELDLFDGSPPCSSFSTAGKRESGWGKVKTYSDKAQRTDDLFFEYARLIRGLRPRTFVAENVSGLVKGTAKGYFLEILKELKSSGYRVEAKLLDAQWLGVPQARQRLIFVGVRNDLEGTPVFPKPLPYRYNLEEAWAGVAPGEKVFCERYSIGKLWKELAPGQVHPRRFSLRRLSFAEPSSTVTQTMGNAGGQVKFAAAIMHPSECRYPTIQELKRVCGFPDDFVLLGTFAQQWERCGRAVPPVMMAHIASAVRDGILNKA